MEPSETGAAVQMNSKPTVQMFVSKGKLLTWGLGKSGQLGTGKDQTEHTPQLIRLMSSDGKKVSNLLKQVACGGLYTAVLTEDGDMFTSGCGKYGRLASGDEEDRSSFSQVALPEKLKQISCGSWHGAGVTLSGGLLVWGHRKGCGTDSAATNAQASTTLTPPRLLPQMSEHKIAGVACGYNFTLAWTEEGKVMSWGSGHHGVLGHGSKDDVTSARVVTALNDEVVVNAAAGYTNSAFVTRDGRVYMSGKGKDGALGLGGHLADVTTPKVVTFPDSVQVVQVSSSVGEHHGHTLALTSDGKVYSWGDGYKGKLGLGNQDSKYTPTLIPPSSFNQEHVTVVCAGGIHSTAATAEGNVYTWGCGSDGRLGHPEGQGHRYLFRSDVPQKVEALESKSKSAVVSCSYYHTAALVA